MSESGVASFIYKEGEDRPWYFSTLAVYDSVKSAVSALPVSPSLFNKIVETLSTLTQFLKEKTGANVVVVNEENATELIGKLDGFMHDQLIVVDDGCDHLRSKLAFVLQGLIDGLVAQKNLSMKKLADLADRSEVFKQDAVTAAKDKYEYVLNLLKSAVSAVKARYPETYEKVSAVATNAYQRVEDKTTSMLNSAKSTTNTLVDLSKTSVNEKITETSAYILKTAQPYVHSAVQRSTPYVVTAVEVSQPYVVQAKPYYEPIIQRAQEVRQALEGSELVGPYVVRACDTANWTMEGVKVYCFSNDVDVGSEGEDVVEEMVKLESEEEAEKPNPYVASVPQHAIPVKAKGGKAVTVATGPVEPLHRTAEAASPKGISTVIAPAPLASADKL